MLRMPSGRRLAVISRCLVTLLEPSMVLRRPGEKKKNQKNQNRCTIRLPKKVGICNGRQRSLHYEPARLIYMGMLLLESRGQGGGFLSCFIICIDAFPV